MRDSTTMRTAGGRWWSSARMTVRITPDRVRVLWAYNHRNPSLRAASARPGWTVVRPGRPAGATQANLTMGYGRLAEPQGASVPKRPRVEASHPLTHSKKSSIGVLSPRCRTGLDEDSTAELNATSGRGSRGTPYAEDVIRSRIAAPNAVPPPVTALWPATTATTSARQFWR